MPPPPIDRSLALAAVGVAVGALSMAALARMRDAEGSKLAAKKKNEAVAVAADGE